jgi:hypothetical protein
VLCLGNDGHIALILKTLETDHGSRILWIKTRNWQKCSVQSFRKYFLTYNLMDLKLVALLALIFIQVSVGTIFKLAAKDGYQFSKAGSLTLSEMIKLGIRFTICHFKPRIIVL